MTVLFLSQIVPYPPKGGVLQRGFNLLRELSKHADVHLLAFVHRDELATQEAIDESRLALAQFCSHVEYFPLWAKQSRLHRAAALAAGVCSTRPFSTVAHASTALRRRITQLVGEGRPDLLHVDTVGLHEFASAVPAALPALLTHHNIESMLMERRAQFEAGVVARWALERESRKLRRYEATASRAYRMNVVMSRQDEVALHERAPGVRTTVIPNGVDIEYFVPAPASQTPTLIYAGGMNMFANRDAVLYFLQEIWPLIVAQVPDAQFLAVGQDPPDELRAFAARDPRVAVPGKVPDIRPYINRASVYVVPLRVGGGTRLKVLDAMACGKAMVSTSVGCEGLEVQAGEHLEVADEPAAFARATIDLLNDPARRDRLGRSARALVERKYAWPLIGAKLIDAYEEAIAASDGSRCAR